MGQEEVQLGRGAGPVEGGAQGGVGAQALGQGSRECLEDGVAAGAAGGVQEELGVGAQVLKQVEDAGAPGLVVAALAGREGVVEQRVQAIGGRGNKEGGQVAKVLVERGAGNLGPAHHIGGGDLGCVAFAEQRLGCAEQRLGAAHCAGVLE